jgi:hypothetical protein
MYQWQPLQRMLFRLCDQKMVPPHPGQLPNAGGRQLANGHHGHNSHAQKRRKTYLPVRTTTSAPHSGQSRRHGTRGRRFGSAA